MLPIIIAAVGVVVIAVVFYVFNLFFRLGMDALAFSLAIVGASVVWFALQYLMVRLYMFIFYYVFKALMYLINGAARVRELLNMLDAAVINFKKSL